MKMSRLVISRLSESARTALVDELVQWSMTVWHGKEDEIRAYWMENKSIRKAIYLIRDDDGTLAGAAAFQYYEVPYKGREIVVCKIGVGASPGRRGNNFTLRSVATEILLEKLRHPFEDLYFFSTLIHPVTYKFTCEVCHDRMYPHYEAPHPPELVDLAQHLAKIFEVETVDSPYPFVYKERYTAIEPPDTREYWRSRNDPAVRYFLDHCPKYHTGEECFITVAPTSLTRLAFNSVKTVVRNELTKRLKGRKSPFRAESA